jgi:hypothetical protein
MTTLRLRYVQSVQDLANGLAYSESDMEGNVCLPNALLELRAGLRVITMIEIRLEHEMRPVNNDGKPPNMRL